MFSSRSEVLDDPRDKREVFFGMVAVEKALELSEEGIVCVHVCVCVCTTIDSNKINDYFVQ